MVVLNLRTIYLCDLAWPVPPRKIGGMFRGDYNRKTTLADFGARDTS